MSAHARTGCRELDGIARQTALQSAWCATPGLLSTTPEPSVPVRVQTFSQPYSYKSIPSNCLYLRWFAFVENMCTCENGLPLAGADCVKDGAKKCSGCQPGWTLSQDRTTCTRTCVHFRFRKYMPTLIDVPVAQSMRAHARTARQKPVQAAL